MTHDEFVASINQFLEGSLDPVEWAEFVEHERQCHACSSCVDDADWASVVRDGECLASPRPQDCLKPETLQRWAKQELPPQLAQIVVEHLAECLSCFTRAEGIAG